MARQQCDADAFTLMSCSRDMDTRTKASKAATRVQTTLISIEGKEAPLFTNSLLTQRDYGGKTVRSTVIAFCDGTAY